MIHYQLRCGKAHSFDGWFNDSGSFEKQAKRGLIECPECGGTDVERGLMAPAVAKRQAAPVQAEPAAPPPQGANPTVEKVAAPRLPAQMIAALQRIRAEVEKNCDYVGPDFAETARAIHRGEAAPRGIYGESTEEQAESLAEDGISVARIPWVPRADGQSVVRVGGLIEAVHRAIK